MIFHSNREFKLAKIDVSKALPFATRFSKFALLWGIIGLFIVSISAMTIQNVIYGAKIATYEKKIAQIRKESTDLSQEISGETSLTVLQNTSESEGFIVPTDTLYVSGDDYVAQLQ